MGPLEPAPRSDRKWIVLFLAGLIAGLILRFYLASFAAMPGHGDSAFYYTVAKNIVAGRGPVIDYIVYFFSGLLPLPHYAGDFWNPSASYLIAIPMFLFGVNIRSALIAPILAGMAPALSGFLAGRKYTGSTAAGALAGILTFFTAFEVWFSVTTEAIIFAGAFGSVGLYLMMKDRAASRWFLLAAVFTGLANLIRQDYILLFVTLEACILLAALPWKKKLMLAAATLLIHVSMLSPLLWKNYTELHTLFPSGPGKTAFLVTYEDFHSYGKEIDWYTLRASWGIMGILKHRLHTAEENLNQVQYFLTPLLSVLLLFALADVLLLHRDRGRLWLLLPAGLFALLEYLFYTFVASFSGPGSLIKSLAALLPFMSMLIIGSLASYTRDPRVLLACTLAISSYSAYQGFQKNLSSTLYYNGMYQEYDLVRSMIMGDAKARGLDANQIAILARDTWEVNEATGLKTVMVPNNDIDTILFVAQHYDAHYLLLPAKRPQLDKIYTGVAPDPRFHFVGSLPNSPLKIFWMDFPGSENQSNGRQISDSTIAVSASNAPAATKTTLISDVSCFTMR